MQTKSVWLCSVCSLCCAKQWQCMNSKKNWPRAVKYLKYLRITELQIILEIQGPCGLITEQVLLAYIEIMGPTFSMKCWKLLQRKKKSTKYSFRSAFLFSLRFGTPCIHFHIVFMHSNSYDFDSMNSLTLENVLSVANTKTKWHVSDKIFTRHVGDKINKKILSTTDRITCICEWASGYLQPWNSYKGYNEKIHFDDCAD